jgi:hypothetical protein
MDLPVEASSDLPATLSRPLEIRERRLTRRGSIYDVATTL